MNRHLFINIRDRGQGLVEYAVILALVAVVVIVVMRIMGPKIGNTFSTINNSLSISSSNVAPSGPYTHAANEGGTFNLPAGLWEVQYGANGTYYYQWISGPTTVGCNNGTFGDPIPGVVKSCAYR